MSAHCLALSSQTGHRGAVSECNPKFQLNLAQNVGVVQPEKVRILPVLRIPLPAHLRVKQLAKQLGLVNADTAGLTAGHGVIVRLDCADNLPLHAHEFVHVAQYEQKDFLKDTLNKSPHTDT
jgi:hypothetical protein